MPDEFDPYLAWLGIPPTARPANHYQLLGLAEWETDRDRIAAAADQRMGEVRSYQTGPRGKFTQKILNELSVAKLCLLDARAKEAYDVGLARQRTTFPATAPQSAFVTPYTLPMPTAAPPPVAPPTVPPPVPPPTTVKRNSRGQFVSPMMDEVELVTSNRWWLLLGLLFLIVIIGSVVAVYSLPTVPPTPQDNVAEVNEPPVKPIVKPALRPSLDEPLVILQEGSGDLSFPASIAELSEGLQRREEAGEALIEGWQADTTTARWRFKIIRPAVFQVRLVYVAQAAEGAAWQLAVDDDTKTRDVESSPAPGEVVTDEFFWRVPRGGEHTFALSLASLPSGTAVSLKSVRFIFQPGGKLQ